MQIVTGVEVIIENFLPEVRKTLPQDQRSRATLRCRCCLLSNIS